MALTDMPVELGKEVRNLEVEDEMKVKGCLNKIKELRNPSVRRPMVVSGKWGRANARRGRFGSRFGCANNITRLCDEE